MEIPRRPGWVEVIFGSMFSGKSELLISRLKREVLAKREVRVFKPSLDTRFHLGEVVSRCGLSITAHPIQDPTEIFDYLTTETRCIGIDECQFLPESLLEVTDTLARRGLRVICCGLDLDYLGNPFGVMPKLISSAEYPTKVHAICMKCGEPACRSQRLVKAEGLIVLGDHEYEARCRQCFSP